MTTGFTTGGYFDGTAQSVQSYPTGSFDFNAAIVGGTAGFSIWIDWDNDLVFDNATEKVFNTTSYGSGPFTGTVTIPGGTAIGNYTMRIVTHYNSQNPTNPCESGNRLEFEDYTINVTTPPAPCLAPTTLAANTITSTSADLAWTSTGGTWDIELGTGGFTPTGTPTTTGTTTNPHNISGLTPATSYDFYVRNDCAVNQSSWVGPFNFSTLVTPCIAPTALTANTITSTSADLAWTSTGGTWDIELGTGGFAPTGTPTTTGTTTNPHNTSGLTAATSYDFYVRNDCAVNQSPWVGPFNFSTLSMVIPCNTPTNGLANNITNSTADLAWTENGTAITWDIELGTNGFTPTGTATTASTSINPTNVTGLTSGTAYNFYVRADCGTDSSTWAGPFDFSTTTVGINETTIKLGLSIYPNPTNGIFTLNIKAKNVIVEIMNTTGQVIFIKNNVNTNEQIDLSNNAKGVYFVTITSKETVTTQKVIVR